MGGKTDHLSLGDQLAGVELGGDGFQNLVDDRGEYSLVIVGTKLSVASRREKFGFSVITPRDDERSCSSLEGANSHGRKVLDGRSGQDTTGDVDHLQIYQPIGITAEISPLPACAMPKRGRPID